MEDFKEQNKTVHFSTVMECESRQLVEIWRDMVISPDVEDVSPSAKYLEGVVPSARTSLLMLRIDRPIARINSSLVLYRVPQSDSFTLVKRSKSHGLIGCVRWMFQNLPLPAEQGIRENSRDVTPCIVMKNDGILYHKCFTQSLKTFLCTTTSWHFNFDPGTLLQFCNHGLRALVLSL